MGNQGGFLEEVAQNWGCAMYAGREKGREFLAEGGGVKGQKGTKGWMAGCHSLSMLF